MGCPSGYSDSDEVSVLVANASTFDCSGIYNQTDDTELVILSLSIVTDSVKDLKIPCPDYERASLKTVQSLYHLQLLQLAMGGHPTSSAKILK